MGCPGWRTIKTLWVTLVRTAPLDRGLYRARREFRRASLGAGGRRCADRSSGNITNFAAVLPTSGLVTGTSSSLRAAATSMPTPGATSIAAYILYCVGKGVGDIVKKLIRQRTRSNGIVPQTRQSAAIRGRPSASGELHSPRRRRMDQLDGVRGATSSGWEVGDPFRTDRRRKC